MNTEGTSKEKYICTCSFCGKTNQEVEVMVASSPAFMCNECITTSVAIIADKRRKKIELTHNH